MKKGDVISHRATKTVTESDNNLFCLLTMNHHPVHLDKEYAAISKHGKILVVGTYVLSLVVGITVPDISIDAIANLGYDKVAHHNPVFIGDTISAATEVLDIYESKSTKVLEVKTVAINQHGHRVLSFHRKVLLPK